MQFKGTSGRAYEQLRELSTDGGMSFIFLVRRDDGVPFVRKEINGASDSEQERAQRFARFRAEQEALARVSDIRLPSGDGTTAYEEALLHPQHPNDEAGAWTFTMQYIDYASHLTDWAVRQRERVFGDAAVMSPEAREEAWFRRVAGVAVRVLDLLALVHQRQVVHRDIKPENILVRTDPGTDVVSVHLADFGIAKLMDRESSLPGEAKTSFQMGTARYRAPEQVGATPWTADYSSDVYASAITLSEALMGRHPMNEQTNIMDFTPLIRYAQLADTLRRAVQVGQRDRPTTSELRAAFAAVAERQELPYRYPIRVESGALAWRPHPRPYSNDVDYEPVWLPDADVAAMSLHLRASQAGILVRCAGQMRVRVRAAGFPDAHLTVSDGVTIPWMQAVPGAWHDVLPEGVNEPSARLTVPHVQIQGAAEPAVFRKGSQDVWGIKAVRVQPSTLEVSFWWVRMTDLFVEPVPAVVERTANNAVWTLRQEMRVSKLEVLVVWSNLASNGFIAVFGGGESLSPIVLARAQEVAGRIRNSSLRGEVTSSWPWTTETYHLAERCMARMENHPALRDIRLREQANIVAPQTWIAAWRVVTLARSKGASAIATQDWNDLFQSARLQQMDESELFLHPAAPQVRRLAISGPTRLQVAPPSGRLAARGALVEFPDVRSEQDVFRACSVRSAGSLADAYGPTVEIAWAGDRPDTGTLVRLFRPQTLTVGRWDPAQPPHLALFVSDRVSRRCLSIGAFADRTDVYATYPEYVRVREDAVRPYDPPGLATRYVAEVADPAFQRRCSQCGGRFDSMRERCPRHPSAYAPLDARAAKAVHIHGYADTVFGPGASASLERAGITTTVASGWVQITRGVTIHVGTDGVPQLHLDGVSVVMNDSRVPAGVSKALTAGTLVVPDRGIRARVVFSSGAR